MYAQQLALDDREEFETDRDKIEYAMLFVNGEAVQKVQQTRKMEKLRESGAGEFNEQLTQMFGRKLSDKPVQQELDDIKVVRKR